MATAIENSRPETTGAGIANFFRSAERLDDGVAQKDHNSCETKAGEILELKGADRSIHTSCVGPEIAKDFFQSHTHLSPFFPARQSGRTHTFYNKDSIKTRGRSQFIVIIEGLL